MEKLVEPPENANEVRPPLFYGVYVQQLPKADEVGEKPSGQYFKILLYEGDVRVVVLK